MIRNHINICICTYKRPHRLSETLSSLANQDSDGRFTYSIIVVDNDASASAKQVVDEFSYEAPFPVKYAVEPEQNIALARNMTLENCDGDHVAFIDDDELAKKDWLLKLWKCIEKYDANGALGPVIPKYEVDPPNWVVRGKIFERQRHETGYVLSWRETRTGNALVNRELFEHKEHWFLPVYGSGGEDRDFFRRMIRTGKRFVWCDESPVYEIIPELRWNRKFLYRRALLRGQKASELPTFKWRKFFKSCVLIMGYSFILCWIWMFGIHYYVKYKIKICDHIGMVMGTMGIKPIKVKYVMESTE